MRDISGIQAFKWVSESREASVFPSWNRRGGCAIKKKAASEAAQTGWSVVTKCFSNAVLQHSPRLTTPSAPSKEASRHLSR
jgi:hypothetical protein